MGQRWVTGPSLADSTASHALTVLISASSTKNRDVSTHSSAFLPDLQNARTESDKARQTSPKVTLKVPGEAFSTL